jgi:hypothetical protein
MGGFQRSFGNLSVSDIRPGERGEMGGFVDVTCGLGSKWAATLSGNYGGAWFDFVGPGVAGDIEDVSWRVRGGVDRKYRASETITVFMGPGIEYGEARSWLHTSTSRDAGPRVFGTGASFRLGLSVELWRSLKIVAGLDQSVHWAHAVDSPTGSTYRWMGRSLATGIGLGYVMGSGRE